MIPAFDETLRRRASWSILVLALVAYVALGLSDHGSRIAGMAAPDAPLPFERHRVFGVDLRAMSSLDALEWLNAAGNRSYALVIAPIDADVVLALGDDGARETALAAIDNLRAAANASRFAVCLRRPPDVVGGAAIAQAAVAAIEERFPEGIVYASACEPDQEPRWQEQVAAEARPEGPQAGARLIALAAGADLGVRVIDRIDAIDAGDFGGDPGSGYVALSVQVDTPLEPAHVARAAAAMTASPHAALVLVAPDPGADAAAIAASIVDVTLAGGALPDGFSSLTAPGVLTNETWRQTAIGSVSYLRTDESGAAVAADVVGSNIYLIGLQSPEGGRVQVWIDPPSTTAQPSATIDMRSEQAVDVAVPLARELPAARHRVVLQAVAEDGQTVTLSGLFVTGRPTTAWTGALASTALIGVAVAALGERCYASVASIQRGLTRPRRFERHGNPRVFSRDR